MNLSDLDLSDLGLSDLGLFEESLRDEELPAFLRSRGLSPENEKGATVICNPSFEFKSGGVLLSHTVPRAVPSTLRGLTSGFGMGPGVSLSL